MKVNESIEVKGSAKAAETASSQSLGGSMTRKIWEVIVALTLYAVIFYAGAMSGVYFENRRLVLNDRRMEKIEAGMKENAVRLSTLEAVTQKKGR